MVILVCWIVSGIGRLPGRWRIVSQVLPGDVRVVFGDSGCDAGWGIRSGQFCRITEWTVAAISCGITAAVLVVGG